MREQELVANQMFGGMPAQEHEQGSLWRRYQAVRYPGRKRSVTKYAIRCV